jgi:hypothetical protein
MPARVLRRIEDLATEVELPRSEVVSELCDYCLHNKEIIDEIFPWEVY